MEFSTATPLLLAVPEVVILIAGPVWLLVWRRRLPRQAVVLAVVGCGLMLATPLIHIGWVLLWPTLIGRQSFDLFNLSVITMVVNGVATLIYLAALTLLIGAVLSCRGPRTTPNDGFDALVAGQPVGALVTDRPVSGPVGNEHAAAPVPAQRTGTTGFTPLSGTTEFAPPSGVTVPGADKPDHGS
ncbi:hypothetical protein [Plantactinospora sp. B24E8]|uniref:hypothetical protein n=1 Tax=Plantactinospora sp. B24E8 TaxID=3153567 RepID=UPI00325CA27F